MSFLSRVMDFFADYPPVFAVLVIMLLAAVLATVSALTHTPPASCEERGGTEMVDVHGNTVCVVINERLLEKARAE